MPRRHDDVSPLAFLRRVRDALLRIAALMALVASHWALDKLMEWASPTQYGPGKFLLGMISQAVFYLVYVYLMYDVLKIFIPWFDVDSYTKSAKKRPQDVKDKVSTTEPSEF